MIQTVLSEIMVTLRGEFFTFRKVKENITLRTPGHQKEIFRVVCFSIVQQLCWWRGELE